MASVGCWRCIILTGIYPRKQTNYETGKSLCVNSLWLSDGYIHWWSNHHWFTQWVVAWLVPSHYLNRCWYIVNWIISRFGTNFSEILIKIQNFASIFLSWPQCVSSDVVMTWHHRCGSTLDQIMACCLMAPSHHLSKYWLIDWTIITMIERNLTQNITIFCKATAFWNVVHKMATIFFRPPYVIVLWNL